MRYAITTLATLVLCLRASAQVPAVAPEDFSHVVGDWFRIETSATPAQLAVEDPLVLTVRISAKQPTDNPPRRDKVRLFPDDMGRDFIIEDLPEKDTSTERTWVLHYRLKPKRADVTQVPALRLVYYHPGRKRFQTALSEPIALTVTPRAVASTPPEIAKALRAPPSVYDIVTGPAVLEPSGPRWLLQPWALALLLLLPPAGCAIWYAYWRRHHPDAVRELKQRRHRAAAQSLRDLQSGEPSPQRLAGVVTEYLRRRLDLSGAEPTPREVDEHLRRSGVSKTVRAAVREFMQRCDAARFGSESESPALVEAGVSVVKALEAEPCLERHI